MASKTDSNQAGSFVSVAWGSVMRPMLEGDRLHSSAIIGIVGILGLVAVGALISPRVDPNEPPVLKPTIPLIGHIVNIIRHGTMLLPHYRKHGLPAATLPMLNGKMYAIWDPTIIQSMFRKKGFSIENFAATFAANVSDMDSHMRDLFHNTPMTTEGIESFGRHLKGESLRKMNITALRFIEEDLHRQLDGSKWLEVPNLFLWLRDTMSLASSHALWGSRNPLSGRPDLLEDFWAFENEILIMALNMFPRITARRAYQGRARVQAALGEFYKAGYEENEDTSDLIRARAKFIRRYDVSDEIIGKMEIAVLGVSLSNTIPTLFWLLAHIISTPGLAKRICEELQVLLRRDGDEATLDVTQWDSQCPLLISCYRETLRLTSTATVTRQVSEDTTVVSRDGKEFTIKANIDVQVSGIASHTIPEVWGPNVSEFDPERFLVFVDDPSAEHVKEMKAAFHPFGGGRHMCPGRHFAFTEILTYVAVLLLGCDIQPADRAESWKSPPQRTQGSMAEAIAKPVHNGEGFGAKIRRRPGWEEVRWHFTV